jgi:hypothetical protein
VAVEGFLVEVQLGGAEEGGEPAGEAGVGVVYFVGVLTRSVPTAQPPSPQTQLGKRINFKVNFRKKILKTSI